MAKILVVDDDPGVVETITMVLTKEGHLVASAGTRQEGMKTVRSFKPDLLILDCMLDQPDDGVVMARDLREEGFSKPILMLSSINLVTGMNLDKDEDICPVDEFAEKPIQPKALVEKVNELL